MPTSLSPSVCRAFLGCQIEKVVDELNLWKKIVSCHPSSLPVWSKISNTLKRLGFQSHNFLTQLLSETSRACTIRVRRSTLGRLWNELGSHAGRDRTKERRVLLRQM